MAPNGENEGDENNTISDTWSSTSYLFGFMAWVALCLIVLTSLPFVRRRAFNVFFYTHFLFAIFLIFSAIHEAIFIVAIAVALVLYGYDKIHFIRAHLKPVQATCVDTSSTDLVKLTYPNKYPRTHQPGQYVSQRD